MTLVLMLCTGNAARSVMAGAALAAVLPEVRVETAGTLAVDGLPMSWRTSTALASVGLSVPRHRSRQAAHRDLAAADLVVGLAPEHVDWVRREHPGAAARTGTLKRLARDLGTAPGSSLAARVASLQLGQLDLEPWEEVVDPGGGEVEQFTACAHEIAALVDTLAGALHRSA